MKTTRYQGKLYRLVPMEQPVLFVTFEGFEVLKSEATPEMTIEENISPEVGLEELEMIVLSLLVNTMEKEFRKASKVEIIEKSEWIVNRLTQALAEVEAKLNEQREEEVFVN